MRSFRFRAIAVATTLALALTLPAIAPELPRAAAAAEPKPPAATTFAMPLKSKSYSVVSYFGARCIPLPGASTYHLGLDMAAPAGAPIYAVAAGVVVATVSGTNAQAGYVKLRHVIDGTTYTSIYYHVWKATTQVKVGQTVTAGQRISEVGNSGV
ncbi:MAG: M23 family metallopeptidase, partial [Candidatus Cloacimonetes bacterium]|nr:M23 family metallopeptidase [Candidatus Cloacimonadota bacterium]